MTVTRAGIGSTGCNPITNEQRIAWWEARMTRWIAEQRDPHAEDVARGRQAEKGLAFKKDLRKRKRFKVRKPKVAKNTNVVPMKRRA
jgi:hypothetical protein